MKSKIEEILETNHPLRDLMRITSSILVGPLAIIAHTRYSEALDFSEPTNEGMLWGVATIFSMYNHPYLIVGSMMLGGALGIKYCVDLHKQRLMDITGEIQCNYEVVDNSK